LKFNLDEGTAFLERTPATLTALLQGLPPNWVKVNEGAATWSAFDVVGHLIDGEETDWIPRAKIILDQGAHRVFEPFDRFRHLSRNRERHLDDLLIQFAELRRRNLDQLRGFELTEVELALQGEHPEFGVVTLAELLATWVVHDLGHIAQITRVLSKQYAHEVGPWQAYLPVLHRS